MATQENIERGTDKAESITDANRVPNERAGVSAGSMGEIRRMWKDDSEISVTEVVDNKRKKIKLKVDNGQKNPGTNKWEYQLKDDSGNLYKSGAWFAETELGPVKHGEIIEKTVSNSSFLQGILDSNDQSRGDMASHTSEKPSEHCEELINGVSGGKMHSESDYSSPNTLTWNSNADQNASRRPLTRTILRFFGYIRSATQRQRKVDVENQLPLTENRSANSKSGNAHSTKVRELESCPNGYSRLAAFNASEQNFMLYRSFSYAHARLLLSHQASISALERELDELDNFHNEQDDERPRLGSWEVDDCACETEKSEGDRTRKDVLEELHKKVCEYDEVLIKARELVSFQRPTNRDYNSVRNWIHQIQPLCQGEQEYVEWREDMVSLRHGREWAGFDGLIEQLLHKFNCRLIRKIFCTDDLRRKTSDNHVYYFSPSRVEKLVGLIITSVIFVLLVLPVVGMYRLSSLHTNKSIFAAIGVLIVFTFLFAAAMSVLTKARRHELFAASAAYCAVLVVFINSTNFS